MHRRTIVAVCACIAAPGLAASVSVRVVRGGRELRPSDPDGLAGKLLALLESCSVDSGSYADPEAAWREITGSRSFAHAVFTAPGPTAHIVGANRERLPHSIREILLALVEGEAPAHVHAKTESATLSLTKYDPRKFCHLVLDTALDLPLSPACKRILVTPARR